MQVSRPAATCTIQRNVFICTNATTATPFKISIRLEPTRVFKPVDKLWIYLGCENGATVLTYTANKESQPIPLMGDPVPLKWYWISDEHINPCDITYTNIKTLDGNVQYTAHIDLGNLTNKYVLKNGWPFHWPEIAESTKPWLFERYLKILPKAPVAYTLPAAVVATTPPKPKKRRLWVSILRWLLFIYGILVVINLIFMHQRGLKFAIKNGQLVAVKA